MRTVCFFFRRISVVFFLIYNDTSNQIKKVITTYPIINFSYSRYENHRNHFDANQKNALKMLVRVTREFLSRVRIINVEYIKI